MKKNFLIFAYMARGFFVLSPLVLLYMVSGLLYLPVFVFEKLVDLLARDRKWTFYLIDRSNVWFNKAEDLASDG